MRLSNRNLTLLALAMAAAPALVAQESTGTVVGAVRTKGGEAVAGAEVRFNSPNLQGTRVVVTDARGAFRAPLLPPGIYRITVVKEGYVAPKVEFDLPLGQVVRQEITIAQAQASAVVEVIATAAAVDKTDVKTQTNVSSELMDVLPRVTRGMDTAALLTPGVSNTGQGGRVQIRGGQSTQNRFLLNGTDIADNVFGNTDGRTYYVDDSIQEMQVIQSPVNARYGNFTGGIINAITKSGGNEFSGTVRGIFSRPSWSAQAPLGPFRWGPTQSRPSNAGNGNTEDFLTRRYTVNIGGPIIKDLWWFSFSTKQDPAISTPQTFSSVQNLNTYDSTITGLLPAVVPGYASGAGQSGGPFMRKDVNTFYEIKMTFALTPAHTLEVAGNRNKTEQENRFYIATPNDFNTLTPQTNENEYYTIGYKGVIGNNWTVEARAAKKHQLLAAGGDPAKGDPIRAAYSNGGYFIFNNSIFNYQDGGDNRDIYTYTANVQYFSPETAFGTHTLDMGFEILNQKRQAANDQSPTSRQFFVWGRNVDGTYRVAGPALPGSVPGTNPPVPYGDIAKSWNQLGLYFTSKGTAITDTQSFYINDLWTLNNRWSVMLGLRYDKSTSSDTLGASLFSTTRISPRFQATYDLFGDNAWVARASWARYNGKLNDGYSNRFGFAGNPVSEWFPWAGAANNAATFAQVTNIANWNVSAAGLVDYGGPLNRFSAKDVQAPFNDEASLNLKHGFKDGSFISYTYTQRKYAGFFNDFFVVGDEVNVPLHFVSGNKLVRAERWRTDDSLKRDYKSFEVEFLSKLNAKWSFGGNYTYAILKGNSEGSEGNNPPVQGDVIGNYTAIHNLNGRDGAGLYYPYGYLGGDQTHRASLYLTFADRSKANASVYGSLLFNYAGGTTYSLTRSLFFEAQETAIAANSPAASQYPNALNRYYGPRGIGRFNDTFNFDLKLGWEIPLWKTARFFVEATVFNVFNHWQLQGFSTAATAGSSIRVGDALSGYRGNALTPTVGGQTGWGTYDFNNYVGGRSVQLSTGFKW